MNETPTTPRSTSSSLETWWLSLLFGLALAYNLSGVSHHWRMGYLAGCEFRQVQTATTTYYIDRDDNFSLLYETPILGKPWVSILMEVPVYEWCVVLVSRTTELAHHEAARIVSAACFYATLPALWLLLGRLGLPRPRRLLPLALILSAPVYIYYSRAFLIDSMALLGSAWWLVGFVRTMDTRRWPWLVLAVGAGTLAALVKSATFAVWLIPGAVCGAWWLWRDLNAGPGWRRPLATTLWGLATIAVPLGALRAWVVYTDPLKDAHASAWIFSSKALTQGNWGLFDYKAIFSPEVWRFWLGCWEQTMMSRWLIAAGLLAGLALPAARWQVLALGGVFFVAQFMFPYAYAYQDYYYYSCALFALGALGCTLVGALETRLPWWLVAVVTLGPLAAEVNTYWRGYRVEQNRVFDGDLPYTTALREFTPQNSVIVVGGADWAAVAPYYSQRKALMIRHGLEFDERYLHRALQELAGEEVSALVVHGTVRTNRNFIHLMAARLDLDASAPTFSWNGADVYIARPHVRAMREGLKLREHDKRYFGITASSASETDPRPAARLVPPEVAREVLAGIAPAPYLMRFSSGAPGRQGRPDGEPIILAHSTSDVWLEPPAGAKQIEWRYGIFAGAYDRAGDKTDGVEFCIWVEQPDGQERRIYRRLLDPAREPQDRGDQRAVIRYEPSRGEKLRFSTLPGGSAAYDWAYWAGIEVK